MKTYHIISKADNIDALCQGDTLTDAIEELLHLNGYQHIDDTFDWEVQEID